MSLHDHRQRATALHRVNPRTPSPPSHQYCSFQESALVLSGRVKGTESKNCTDGHFPEDVPEAPHPIPCVHKASSKCPMASEATEPLNMALSSSLNPRYYFILGPVCLSASLSVGFCLENARMTGSHFFRSRPHFLWLSSPGP